MGGYDRRTFLGLVGGAGATVVASGTGQARTGAQVSTSVTIQATNSPVGAGDVLHVSPEVWNLEYTGSNVDVVLEVSDEIVDSEQVWIEPRGRSALGLEYETYPVRQDVSFPVTVEAGTDSDTTTVEVYANGPPSPGLDVSIVGTNDPVHAGDWLQVTADVQNTGTTSTSGTARLLVGSDQDQVDAESVSLSGGATRRLTFRYETYPVRQDVSFPVTVTTGDDSDTRTVRVWGRG
ncbi:hypothetical protein [Natronobeatus ordinarius]|uniref:hypothetical protein n=1 Tax=Natronobeatus ordinarius TaxID=2963433 RepID=UPI0020CC1B32|nr:hypothetical protein [Natronobeatus ordinarius]